MTALACCAALAVAGAAVAEPTSPAPEIELRSLGLPLPLPAAAVRVRGTALDGCPPRLSATERNGSEIVLRSVDGGAPCLDQPQPFSLQSAPLIAPPGIYRLRWEQQATPLAAAHLAAFQLVEFGRPQSKIVPEAGFWWGELGGEFADVGPGFGVQVELQDDTVALVVSGYDEAGEPQWLFGAGPLTGRVSSVPLMRLHGGRGPHEPFRAPDTAAEAGRVQIEWLGSARAVFWFERPTLDGRHIELQPVSMVRFGFAAGAGPQWRGRWLLAAVDPAGDDAIGARPLDFTHFEPTGDGFALATDSGERIDCRLDPQRGTSPPTQCRLDAFGLPPIEFDDIGLKRLQGRTADAASQPAVLIRIEQ